MNFLEVKDLSYRYEEDKNMILDHISFLVEEGEFISLVGHNGSGKSTLAKIIIGLIKPTSGEVILNKSNENLNKRIGYVFQNPDNQFVGNTVADDIAFGLENKQVEQKDMDPIIDSVLKKVDMIDFKKYEPQLLSGGQKQRVAIASNLALGLNMIIFDESTSMLDPVGKHEINEVIKELKKENPNITILQITHNMDEVLNSNRVIAIDEGHIVFDDVPDKFFNNLDLLDKLQLKAPFKYRLKHLYKEKLNIDIDVNESIEEIRGKIND